ncbi:hypothetical protein RJG79_12205 [Mycoplasmatota bacterium WC44]
MEDYKDHRPCDRNEAINLLLESIAKEELALAHILYAEGDKIDFVIRKLKHGDYGSCKSIDRLIETNESVRKTIIAAIKKEMLLEFKLENVIGLINKNPHH